jgi:NACHT domain-containing protein
MFRHRGWLGAVVFVAGVVMLAFFLRAGLTKADQLASVISVFLSLVGLAIAWQGLRPAAHPAPSVRYERRYLTWARRSLDNPHRDRADPIGQFVPALGEIYVDVSVVPRQPGTVGGGVVDDVPADLTERLVFQDVLNARGNRLIALLGIPGGGKSTLLRHVLWLLSQRKQWWRPRRRRIPALIELRSVANRIVSAQPPGLPELISDTVGLGDGTAWWQLRLERGRCLVLLDGFDEIVSVSDRAAAAQWIDAQTRRFNRAGFVISSRPYGFGSQAPTVNVVVQVRSFTDRQVRRFLSNWFLAVALRSHPEASRRTLAAPSGRAADELFQRLMDNQALHDLTINPLLLSLIADVHRAGHELPRSRTELYATVCHRILNPPTAIDPLGSRLSPADRAELLGRLAVALMRRKVTIGDETFVRQALGVLPADVPAGEFLDFAVRTGMLVRPRQDTRYAFAHLTFQEFLCARQLIGHPAEAHLLESGVDDAWWHEVIMLWAAGAVPDRVVEACLGSGGIRALSLATACVDTARGRVDPALVRRLEDQLAVAFQPTADLVHQRRVAGVLAMQHLRRSTSTSEGTRLATEPVTTNLYALFLRVQNHVGPAASCEPQAVDPPPAIGMWGADAQAFVDWLNSLDETTVSPYRLPTAAELDGRHSRLRLGLRQNGRQGAVWRAEIGNDPDGRPVVRPRIWVRPGVEHPYQVTQRDMRNALADGLVATGELRFLLSATAQAQVLLVAASLQAVRADAETTRLITVKRLTGGLRAARTRLETAKENGAPLHHLRLAQAGIESWKRAVRRADDPMLDAGTALTVFLEARAGEPLTARPVLEHPEEEWPTRARLVLTHLDTVLADVNRAAEHFRLTGNVHRTPASAEAAHDLVRRLTRLQQLVDALATRLAPALHQQALAALQGGRERVRVARHHLTEATRESAYLAKLAGDLAADVQALPKRKWTSFLPSSAELGRLATPPYQPTNRNRLVPTLRPGVGIALATAAEELSRAEPVGERVLAERVAKELVTRMRIAASATLPGLDVLEPRLRRLDRGVRSGAARWQARAVGQLNDTAGSAFRRQPATRPFAPARARLAAAALTAEAVAESRGPDAAGWYSIVAGITVLEARTRSPESATEVLLLAQA